MDEDTNNQKELRKEIAGDVPSEVPPSPQAAEATADAVQDTSSAEPVVSFTLLPAPALPPLEQEMPTVSQLAVALGILALLFAISYLPTGERQRTKIETERAESADNAGQEAHDTRYFEDVRISAHAAYVWDVKNQRALYNKNAGESLPLASLTKLMTVLVAYENLGNESVVSISPQAVLQQGDSGLSSGEVFPLRELAKLTLMTSSNDGAYALAAAAGAVLIENHNPADTFISAMNAKAEGIGLSQSYFTNPTGLDVDGATSGSYGSARDMAFLMEYLVLRRPELLEGTKERVGAIYNQEGALFRVLNTNEIIDSIPGLIGSKTGFTGLAGGNLVVAYDAGLNRPIIISVLGSTREGRFSDVMAIIAEVFRAIASE